MELLAGSAASGRPLSLLVSEAEAEELTLPCGLERKESSRHFAIAARRLLAARVALEAHASALWVPGRLELAGKHTDYAGGRSLLCAVRRGFYVVSAHRDDALLRVLVTIGGQRAEATLALSNEVDDQPNVLSTSAGGEAEGEPEWVKYPAVVARRLSLNWGSLRGVDLALECDLPPDSGMSSSSAIITLTFLTIAMRNRLASRPEFARLFPNDEALCHYLGCIENGQDCGPELPGAMGVGTFGGSEDHTAIVCCRPAELRQYSFCPTRLERVIPFPHDFTFIIAVSGAAARKGVERRADYNNAAMLARWAAEAAATMDRPCLENVYSSGDGSQHDGARLVSDGANSAITLAAVIRLVATQKGTSPSSDEVVEELSRR